MLEGRTGAIWGGSNNEYRYVLWRDWSGEQQADLFGGIPQEETRTICWLLHNPSTADEHTLDPTLTRCFRWSRKWSHDHGLKSYRYGRMLVVNLFAYRSTDPSGLKMVKDPVGPENLEWIKSAIALSDKLILGWGVPAVRARQADTVLNQIRLAGATPFCLKKTHGAHPAHPLYLKNDVKPIRF